MKLAKYVCVCLLLLSTHINAETLKIGMPTVLDGEAPERPQIGHYLQHYWQSWGEEYGYEVSFVFDNYENLVDKVLDDEVHLIATYPVDGHISEELLVSLPYISIVGALYERIEKKNNGRIALNIPENVDPAYFERYSNVVIHTGNTKKVIREIDNVDYLYTLHSPDIKEYFENNERDEEFVLSNEHDPGIRFSVATSRQNQALMAQINHDFVHADFSEELQRWYRSFAIGSTYYSLLIGSYNKQLTPQHLQMVSRLPTLRFPFVRKGGEPRFTSDGFFVDGYMINILKRISQTSGINFEPVGFDNFEDAYNALKNKEIDIFPGLLETDDRAFLSFTQPIGHNITAVVSKDGINNYDQLNGKRIGLVDGHVYNNDAQHIPNAKISTFSKMQDAIMAVSQGESDVYIGDIFDISYQVSNMNLHNVQVLRAHDINYDLPYRIALNKKFEDALNLFNVVIYSLGNELQIEAQTRWKRQINTLAIDDHVQQVTDKYVVYIIVGCLVLMMAFMIYRQNVRKKLQLSEALEAALKKAEEQQAKAESLAHAKSDFLARMSHEIRTPMNGVLGMAEAMTYTPLNSEQTKLMGTLTNSANGLLSLLNDILDFSKMDAGKLVIERIEGNIPSLVKQVHSNFAITAADKGIDLKLVIDPKLHHGYLFDVTRLMQVLNNFVSNAIKFTSKGHVSIEATLTYRGEDNDEIAFYVNDTGIGIDPDTLPILFTPFTQAEDSITRKFGGTGLGLSICKELVEAMGGEITVASIKGNGSQFKVSIALERTDGEQTNPYIDGGKSGNEHSKLHEMRLLFVEDNFLNYQVISNQLERIGVKFDYATNGLEALNLMETGQYDVVLSDCHMPVMDGYELAKNLSSREDRPYLIALTADVMSNAIQKCLDAGFDSYLSKPCPIDILSHKLAHIDIKPREESVPESQANTDTTNTAANTNQQPHTFDPDYVLSLCGGDEAMTVLILKNFLESLDSDLQSYSELENTNSSYKAAFHKIKGNFLYLGLEQLAQEAEALEAQAFDTTTDDLKLKLEELTRALKDSEHGINAYIQQVENQ